MYQEPVVTEIEKTKRALYGCLDRIRRAGKHRKLTAEFEERLEEHFEELRKARVSFTEKSDREIQRMHGEALGLESRIKDLERGLGSMTEERDQIQQRLHAVDHAHFEQSRRTGEMARHIERLKDLNRIAGEELIRAQGVARQYLDDCRSAEKHSDRFSEQLRDAQSVIANQEQLIVGQRLAIAELHMAGRAAKSAVATLERLGYTDCGGQLWKPPIGKRPDFVDYGAELRKQNNGKPSR